MKKISSMTLVDHSAVQAIAVQALPGTQEAGVNAQPINHERVFKTRVKGIQTLLMETIKQMRLLHLPIQTFVQHIETVFRRYERDNVSAEQMLGSLQDILKQESDQLRFIRQFHSKLVEFKRNIDQDGLTYFKPIANQILELNIRTYLQADDPNVSEFKIRMLEELDALNQALTLLQGISGIRLFLANLDDFAKESRRITFQAHTPIISSRRRKKGVDPELLVHDESLFSSEWQSIYKQAKAKLESQFLNGRSFNQLGLTMLISLLKESDSARIPVVQGALSDALGELPGVIADLERIRNWELVLQQRQASFEKEKHQRLAQCEHDYPDIVSMDFSYLSQFLHPVTQNVHFYHENEPNFLEGIIWPVTTESMDYQIFYCAQYSDLFSYMPHLQSWFDTSYYSQTSLMIDLKFDRRVIILERVQSRETTSGYRIILIDLTPYSAEADMFEPMLFLERQADDAIPLSKLKNDLVNACHMLGYGGYAGFCEAVELMSQKRFLPFQLESEDGFQSADTEPTSVHISNFRFPSWCAFLLVLKRGYPELDKKALKGMLYRIYLEFKDTESLELESVSDIRGFLNMARHWFQQSDRDALFLAEELEILITQIEEKCAIEHAGTDPFLTTSTLELKLKHVTDICEIAGTSAAENARVSMTELDKIEQSLGGETRYKLQMRKAALGPKRLFWEDELVYPLLYSEKFYRYDPVTAYYLAFDVCFNALNKQSISSPCFFAVIERYLIQPLSNKVVAAALLKKKQEVMTVCMAFFTQAVCVSYDEDMFQVIFQLAKLAHALDKTVGFRLEAQLAVLINRQVIGTGLLAAGKGMLIREGEICYGYINLFQIYNSSLYKEVFGMKFWWPAVKQECMLFTQKAVHGIVVLSVTKTGEARVCEGDLTIAVTCTGRGC
ncbi:hypothetical protein ACFL96_17100, partial [Thermoproteota archaeon]